MLYIYNKCILMFIEYGVSHMALYTVLAPGYRWLVSPLGREALSRRVGRSGSTSFFFLN